jgi:LMBR1 domain-containing protein 1
MLIVVNGIATNAFFNNILTYLEEKNTGFVAIAIYGFLAYYMLWVCMKGNIKFGIRCLCCCLFYPMVPNETFMNSFIVNMILFNLWSIALTHFCTIAFAEYTRLTDANMIFAVQLSHMNFFSYFWDKNVFIYILVIWAVITLVYLLCQPHDRLDIAALTAKDIDNDRV